MSGRLSRLLPALALLLGARGLPGAAQAQMQTVTLSASPNPVVEGESLTVTATLSAPVPNWTSNNLGYQYLTASVRRFNPRTRLFIAAGERSGSVEITTHDGANRGPVGTFSINIHRILNP